jgi:histone deacetylase 1/2
MYEYCRSYVSGSMMGGNRINQLGSDVVFNWAGGMHHAKKSEVHGLFGSGEEIQS